MMIGSIITEIASAAAKPDFPRPRMRIHVARMNRPATIDGSAVIASAMVRTSRVSGPRVSLRNMAQAIPSGTVMIRAIVIMNNVPIMACRMPPTVMGSSGPALDMSCVKKLLWCSAVQPRLNVKPTMKTRASRSSDAMPWITAAIARSRTAGPFSSVETRRA